MSGFGELVFTYTADGAYPIFGKVLEFCTGGYAIVGISYCRIVLVSADFANVLTHNH